MLTQNKRRELGLKLSFSELGNKHYSSEQKEALGKAADKAAEALRSITHQVVGYVVSHFAHVALPTRMAEDDIVDFSAGDFPGAFDDFLSALGESAGAVSLTTGSGSPESVQIDTGTSQDWIKSWGSDLVTGILHNYKDELNGIITGGMKEGLGREEITARLLAQASPEAGALMPEWRARLIAQTEVIRGFNGERLNQLQSIGALYVQWMDGQAGACEDCAAMDGTVLPMEESGQSFYSNFRGLAVEYPPLHPGCRCAISSADVEDFRAQPNLDTALYIPGDTDSPSFLPDELEHEAKRAPAPAPFEPLAADPVVVGIIEKIAGGASVSETIGDATGSFFGDEKYKEMYTKVTDALGLPADATRTAVKEAAAKAPVTTPKAALPPEPVPSPPAVAPVDDVLARIHSGTGVRTAITEVLGDIMPSHPDYKAMMDSLRTSLGLPASAGRAEITSAATGKPLPKPKTPKPPGVKEVDRPTPASMGLKTEAFTSIPADGAPVWNELKQIGPQGGSNPGGLYEAPDGTKYYVKRYADMAQGVAESYTNALYRKLGLEAPEAAIRSIGGKDAYVSKIIEGRRATGEEIAKILKEDPELAARIHVAATLTENWDIFGAGFDNVLITKEGKLAFIDNGGSLDYRARGGAKTFGPDVRTFDTLLDPSRNPVTAKAFGDLYADPKAVAAATETMRWVKDNFFKSVINGIPVSSITMEMKADALLGRLKQVEKDVPLKPIPSTPPVSPDYLIKNGIAPAKAALSATEKNVQSSMMADPKAVADLPKYIDEVEANLRNVLADARLSMRIQDSVLKNNVLEGDGRFKTQFETKTSNGTLNTRVRAAAEKNMFSYPESLTPSLRPVYGYLSPKGGDISGPSHYGNIKLVMKEEVRARATFTFGDSLGLMPYAAPSPVADPKYWSVRAWSKPLNKVGLEDAPSYPEVQYHGGLSIADIDHAILPYSIPRLEKSLTQRGIPYYIDAKLASR